MSDKKPLLVVLSLFLFGSIAVSANDGHDFPQNASFSTLITTPLVVEGLTGDDFGNLYTTGRHAATEAGFSCPVWRINHASPSLAVVGNVPAPSPTGTCSPSGIAFDSAGNLYISDGDKIYRLHPDAVSQPTADVFASGVLGTNGLAFDRHGNLWTGDGTAAQGLVWMINPAGVVTEMFRVQRMTNPVNVGRDVRTVPTGNSQPLVANGLAFNRQGDLFIADTARGAIWKVKFDKHGNPKSNVGCDTTFSPNTLCLDNIYVAHPALEGADGIALDREGNIWVDANERNAVVVVAHHRKVTEIFRNPPDAVTKLRNGGPLETPTSPFLLGHVFCTANSDGNRRDNSPSTAGEIGGVGQPKGKISCMEQKLSIPGLPLPVQ